MNWSLFQSIQQNIEPPFLSAVNGVTSTMVSAVSGVLNAAMVIFVVMIGYMTVSGRMSVPIRDLWLALIKGAVVAVAVTSDGYSQYFQNLFLTTLPNDVVNAITGAAGGSVSASAFDHVWNKAFAGGLAVWKNLSWTDIGLQILVAIYWMSGAVACAFGFLVWLASHILLGLFVAVGPLLVPMFMFPVTRSLFERWIGSMLSMIFLQIFVVVLLVVLTKAEETLLVNIAAINANPIAQIQILFGAIILFLVAAVVIVQLPGAAAALAGGMHFYAAQFATQTFGRATALGTNVRMGLASAGHAAQARLNSGRTMPPGPSLSTTRVRSTS